MISAGHVVAERVARESYGKLLAFLASRSGDVAAAEDALADALTTALERWPSSGIPASPEGWLLVTARRRIVDASRAGERRRRTHDSLAAQSSLEATMDADGDDIPDQRLAMMFACAHPAIAESVRGPLLLQAVLGLDAARIASVFLVAPAAMSQRLVRAKRKIGAAKIPLLVPPPEERAARLTVVLAAIYATFSQGWDDPASVDPRARGFVAEAVWLGRLVARLCPDEPEALGLVALMLHANARAAARRAADGQYVPLDSQDPQRWDAAEINEAESLLHRAASFERAGRFQIEAAIQSVHASRRFGGAVDGAAIVALYDRLLTFTGSPVVALNRAVAIAGVHGAAAGLAELGRLEGLSCFDAYQPYWAARADMHKRSGDGEAARAAFRRAIGLTVDPAIRRYLAARADVSDHSSR